MKRKVIVEIICFGNQCQSAATTVSNLCDTALAGGIRCQIQFSGQPAQDAFVVGSNCLTPLYRKP